MGKICSKCNKEKPLDDFYISRGKPTAECRICHSARVKLRNARPEIKKHNQIYQKQYNANQEVLLRRQATALPPSKRCTDCKEIKPIESFYVSKGKADGKCKNCRSLKTKLHNSTVEAKKRKQEYDKRYKLRPDVIKRRQTQPKPFKNDSTLTIKQCTRCKETKSVNQFRRRKSRAKNTTDQFTYASWCRKCQQSQAEIRRQRYRARDIIILPDIRRCPSCGVTKPADAFTGSLSNKDGLQSWCKECTRLKTSSWCQHNRTRTTIIFPDTKECTMCHITKPAEAFSKSLSSKNGLYSRYKECVARLDKQPNNRKRRSKRMQDWYKTPEGYPTKINHNRRRRDRELLIDSPWDNAHEEFVFAKYGIKCFKCGSTDSITIDHLYPLSTGYPLNTLNAIPLCKTCNSRKCNKHPHNFWDKDTINNRFKIEEFEIKQCCLEDVSNYVRSLHYLLTLPPAPQYVFRLTLCGDTVGACVFGSPSRQNIKADLELSRFFVMDGTPKNTESYFLGGCLRELKKLGFKGKIISFADTTEGHTGIIYKATNWNFEGHTLPNYHYEKDGQRMHKRQVWNRAKQSGIKESEQATSESLIKVNELPKSRWIFEIK